MHKLPESPGGGLAFLAWADHLGDFPSRIFLFPHSPTLRTGPSRNLWLV